MNAIISPNPIEIDPRPCELCGLTIDQHEMIDDGDGPLFYCAVVDDGVADIVRRLELADPRDRWKHVGEAPPPLEVRNSHQKPQPQPYRTADSTRAAFQYVLSLNDADHLAHWLANHPADAAELLKNWKG